MGKIILVTREPILFWRNVKRVTLEAYHRGISLLPRRPRVRNNRGYNSEIRQMPPKRD